MSIRPTDRPLIRPSILVFVIIGVAVLAFLPSLAGGWIHDDHPLIEHNTYVHSLSWWPHWLTHDFWAVDGGSEEVLATGRMMYWRPAISFSYAVDWTLSGGATVWFHAVNLAAHAAVAVLAFFTLRRWLRGHTLPALLAALVFAVHPTKAESVAWIAGRTDVFCMLAVLVATAGVARRLRREPFGLPLEIAGTALAYLCKEQAIVLPAFVVIEAWIALDGPPLDLAFVRRALRAAAPQIVLALVYIGIRSALMPLRPPGVPSLPLGDHVLAVTETFGRFFTLTFAPHELSIQQGLVTTVQGELQHSMAYVVIGLVGLAVLVGAAFASRRRFPGATLGIGIFLATLVPTANVIYTGMTTLVSERFLYLPSFGLAWVAGAVVARLPARAARSAQAVLLALVAAACAIAMQRAADFADEDAFWARELALHPGSSDARQHLISRSMETKHYRRALREVLAMQEALARHDMSAPVAIEIAYQVALVTSNLVPDLDATSLRAIDAFAGELLTGHVPEARLDVPGVKYALKLDPAKHQDRIEDLRARLWTLRSQLATRLGDAEAAVAHIARAKEACSRCTSVTIVEAVALARAGRYDDGLTALASHDADRAIELTRTRLQEALVHRDRSLTATGPVALKEHAQELASLELWGAAYQVLAPHAEELKRAPEASMGFAELAFRAGTPEVATAMLEGRVPASEIPALLDEWAGKMGWRE